MWARAKSGLLLLASLACATLAHAGVPSHIGNDLYIGGLFLPEVDGQYLGSSTFRWRVYTPLPQGASYVDSLGRLQSLSTVSPTALGYLGNATSDVQAQINALTAGTSITLPSSKIFVGGPLGTAVAVSMGGDVTIQAGGTTAITNNAVTNAKAAQMAAHTYKGNNTAGTANALDLTTSQVKTDLAVSCSDLTNASASCSTDATNASNLSSGALPAARLPGLTGDVTAPIGSSTTTLAHGNAGNLDSGTLNAARLPGLAGDVTASPGSTTTTLATANASPGTYTDATVVVDGKGRVTSASATTSQLAASRMPGLTGDVTAPPGSTTTTLAASGVSAGSCTNCNLTIDAKGRVTTQANGTSSGTASGVNLVNSIAQTAHGFSVGNVVYYTGSGYSTAKADSDNTSEVSGIVSAVADANDFTLLTNGYITGLSGLVGGSTYYLSDTAAGAVTPSQPVTVGHVDKPVLIATGATTGYFVNMRGVTIAQQAGSRPYWSGNFNASYTWSCTTGVAYGDCTNTAVGTFAQSQNNNFGTVSAASSNLPGVTFTAPISGVVRVQASMTGFSTTTSVCHIRLFEGGGSTSLDYGTISGAVNMAITMTGFLPVTAGTSYTPKMQSWCAGSSNFSMSQGDGQTLQFKMDYL